MNEPAFPSFDYISQEGRENPKGMTLRDYFAAKAMQTLLTETEDVSRTKLWIAITAYSMADAMLEERK